MDFLTEQQQAATHFIIGLYITYYPDEFKRIFDSGDDIAVHTYTHPHMSSLSNEDLVAQFGWTLQIISDATGGRIPRYWRPRTCCGIPLWSPANGAYSLRRF